MRDVSVGIYICVCGGGGGSGGHRKISRFKVWFVLGGEVIRLQLLL